MGTRSFFLGMLAATTLAACDKNEDALEDLNDDDDVGTTDTGLIPGTGVLHSECYEQRAGFSEDLDEDGDFETCVTSNAEANSITHVGAVVRSLTVYGSTNAQKPATGIDMRAWALRIIDPLSETPLWGVYPANQVYTDDAASILSGDYIPEGATYLWYAWWTDAAGQLGDINEGTPDIDYYTFGTEIDDEDAALDGTCSVYDNATDYKDSTGLDLCVESEWYSGDASDEPWKSDTRCTAGTGTFGMVPLIYQDTDGDGDAAVVWTPVREDSGRGVFTSDAIVKSIKVIEDNGVPFKVVYDGKTYSFGDDDSLVMDSTVRTSTATLSKGRTTFRSGKVTGASSFISTEYPVDTTLDSEVSITWTCPLAATSSSTSSAVPTIRQGYQTTLGDLGCDLYPKQKIVVRPNLAAGYARVALAGQEQHALNVALKPNVRNYFDVEGRGFDIEGSIGSASAADGMDVEFTKITFLGVDQCATGSYTFPKESAR